MLNATVKECLDEFCDRINQPRESAYVSGTTPAARQYVSLFKHVSDELLKFLEWSQLKRIYTFTTTEDVAYYQLPGDFLRPLTGTQWGVTNQIPLAGPLSNARLAFQTYGVNIATPFAGYQINGAQGYIYNTVGYTQKSAGFFQLSPAGQDDTTENVIAYTSCNTVWPRDWVTSTAYVAGDIRTGINHMYIATTSGTSGATRPDWTTGSDSDGTVTWAVYHEPYPISNDADIVLLDKSLFVEGLRWAWYESKQQFEMSDRVRQAWNSQVSTSLGRNNGVTMLNAGYDVNNTLEWPVTPPTFGGPLPG